MSSFVRDAGINVRDGLIQVSIIIRPFTLGREFTETVLASKIVEAGIRLAESGTRLADGIRMVI